MPNKLKQRLNDLGTETRIMELQKVSVLYFARIFQNVLGIFSILADTEPQEIELMI